MILAETSRRRRRFTLLRPDPDGSRRYYATAAYRRRGEWTVTITAEGHPDGDRGAWDVLGCEIDTAPTSAAALSWCLERSGATAEDRIAALTELRRADVGASAHECATIAQAIRRAGQGGEMTDAQRAALDLEGSRPAIYQGAAGEWRSEAERYVARLLARHK